MTRSGASPHPDRADVRTSLTVSSTGQLPPCYLDYNASAPVKPAVIEAMALALGRAGNPSSVHGFGRAARRALEEARASVAALVGARPEAVLFTSGGTEANNQALASVRGPRLVSAVEHASVLEAAPEAGRLPVDPLGRVDLGQLADRLVAAPALVSVMLANNETGVLQPVAEVALLARRHGVRVHCDAVQAAGKLAIDLGALGVDFLTVSAHKLGGPQGVGALVLGEGIEPAALLRGGGQERRWRPGTENLPGIVGFGRACELALEDRDLARRTGALRDRLETEIRAAAPDVRVYGAGAERLSEHQLPRHAGGRQPDPADRARPRGHRGQHGLGLLVRQGRALARAGRDGDRAGRGGLDHPGQPRLGQHRRRCRSPGRRLDPALCQGGEGRRGQDAGFVAARRAIVLRRCGRAGSANRSQSVSRQESDRFEARVRGKSTGCSGRKAISRVAPTPRRVEAVT